MREITPKDSKRLARIGFRATYGKVMLQLMDVNPNIYTLTADLGSSSGLQRLMKAYPDRYLNVGIAEQNLIGVSAGLAKSEFIPFASSFAPFITLRCAEQIKINMGYMKHNVKIVGLASGFAMGELGNSHYGLEDIAVMRAIPNMVVINPADCVELEHCLYAVSEYIGPVYIRLTGDVNVPIVYEKNYNYEIGKGVLLREDTDEVAIIATGSMVYTALQVAKKLEKDNIHCSVVDMHTIKPLDEELLCKVFDNHKLVVSLEEHFLIGGLGSAIAEFKENNDYNDIKLLMIGVPNEYGPTGSYEYQLTRVGLDVESINNKIKNKYLEVK